MSDFIQTDDLNGRFSMFPIKDEKSYKFYKIQEARVWSANELSFIDDAKDYRSATSEQQHLLDVILSFFLPGDGLVNNNIIHRFLTECKTSEETAMFCTQLFIETVHAETYGLIFYTLYTEDEIRKLQYEVNKSSYFRLKTDFMEKWTQSDRPFPERLLAFACAEGIFFSVLFSIIFWFRSKGKFENLIFANELISTDETLHRDFGCYMFRKYGSLPVEKAYEIVNEAVEIEMGFISWLLKDDIEDLNIKDMNKFIGLVADNLLVEAGYERVYKTNNPFPWVDDLSLTKKNNFFEKKGGNYTRDSIGDILNWEKRAGKDDTDNTATIDPLSVDF